MRALGTSVIILALAFSAGGVAYRTQAGSQVAEAESSAPSAPSAGTHDSQQCEVESPVAAKPFVLDLGKLPSQANDVVRPLNRTGYNYREPGIWYPPQPSAPAAPAEPAEPAAADQD